MCEVKGWDVKDPKTRSRNTQRRELGAGAEPGSVTMVLAFDEMEGHGGTVAQ